MELQHSYLISIHKFINFINILLLFNIQYSIFDCEVTHQHQYVGQSRCLLMSDGSIKVDGSFADCVAAANGKIDFVSFNEESQSDKTAWSTESIPTKEIAENMATHIIVEDQNDKMYTKPKAKASKDEQDEKRAKGVVSKATFIQYARSMGGWGMTSFIILLFASSQGASLASLAFVGRWSERPLEEQVSHLSALL